MSLSDQQLKQLAEQTGHALRAAKQRLVAAESCTGGWIAKMMTDLSGASECFDGSIVAYDNSAKETWLGVSPETLQTFGAVSHESVVEMLAGVLARSGGTLAVAVSGIAGPTGGGPDKPIGTVWIGWQRRQHAPYAACFQFDGDRDSVRRSSVAAALRGVSAALSVL